ncbi:MAG: hypothetical protein AB7L13_18860 [Acidimicrobiia bacterium]
MRPYHLLAGLEDVYLEDSYVLDIEAHVTDIRITVQAVLTESHPQYTGRKPGKQHCYRKVVLLFEGFGSYTFQANARSRSIDPDGTVDYQNVDAFTWDESGFALEGSWGSLRTDGGTVSVVLLPV